MRLLPYLRPLLVLLALFTLLTGLLYPLALTALAQIIFPWQANGSLLTHERAVIGSALIGQPFVDPAYFWGRPSLTEPVPYHAAASKGSNIAPSNPLLTEQIQARLHILQAADPENPLPVPVDLVTASASGLDPHISLAAALYQVNRIARERGLPAATVTRLVQQHTETPLWGLYGQPRVNVLRLNLALDGLQSTP
ncbi:MAG: potassium-transporting ATPase subunit KdpC [Anaerolineae bacterium]|nr:potassium-transporting ATPase subunit KdpC [Anaerolineae bacterium]